MTAGEIVILLHGLHRTGRSLLALEMDLRALGYATHSLDYPSTRLPLSEAAQHVAAELDLDGTWVEAKRVHFVTHSMGGLVLRTLIASRLGPEQRARIGHVVMLAPPNQGSRVADLVGSWPIARKMMGPALRDLSPARAALLPGWDAEIPLGIIAGTAGWAYPLGNYCLTSPHDGRVSVEATRLPGMRDHLALPASHSLMMRRRDVRHQVAHFLRAGWFDRASQSGGGQRRATRTDLGPHG